MTLREDKRLAAGRGEVAQVQKGKGASRVTVVAALLQRAVVLPRAQAVLQVQLNSPLSAFSEFRQSLGTLLQSVCVVVP